MTNVLRRVRHARGLGQIATAELIRCSQPSVVNYERGRHRPRAAVRRRMEALFGLPADVLLAPENDEGGDATNPAALTTTN